MIHTAVFVIMSVTYFKRFRMRMDVRAVAAPLPPLDDRYFVRPWNAELVGPHAEAKHRSFRNELDSHVFPSLGTFDGCQKLMREISCRKNFVPESTWLLLFNDSFNGRIENCGTVQGVRENQHAGSIQNLGVVPGHRGLGLGSVLLSHALWGFRQVGIEQAILEVTAHNIGALSLYERLGFQVSRVVFKSIDLRYQ